MAKKDKGTLSFDSLNSFMNSIPGTCGSAMDDENCVSDIKEYINTGNYILNACVSGSIMKGIPANRCTILSGESGTGKTYVLLNIVREAQKQGYYVIYYDSENAVDSSTCKSFGVDLSKIRYEPVQTIQQFKTSVTNFVDFLIDQKQSGVEIPKILICLDSCGNLASQKEIDDSKEGADKADMTRSKQLKSLFRITMSKLGLIGATFVATNHVYKTLDLFAKNVQSGGCLTDNNKVVVNIDGFIDSLPISQISSGMKVKSVNKDGSVDYKTVTKTWTFDKTTYDVTLEDSDGECVVVECSDTHRFNVTGNTDATITANWCCAEDLAVGQEVYCVE